MEESKELQGFYKIFRSVIYVSILLEFFEYAIDPAMLDHWGGILCDIHGRIKRWVIYNDGNLAYSHVPAYMHHLHRDKEQEETGVQCTETSSLSYHNRYVAGCIVCLAVRISDGNKALHFTVEHLALYACLNNRRGTGTHCP